MPACNRLTAVLDTIVCAETPEGILLELRPAGVTSRLYAFLLDALIRLVVIITVEVLGGTLGHGIGWGLTFVLVFGLEWLYPVAFELTRRGATPGKRALSLKVIMDNGLPVTPAASLTRNLLRAADFLPFAYGFALISMLVRPDFKRLGDLAAATLVVYDQRSAAKTAPSDVAPLAPAVSIPPHDQAAIIALAMRAARLTPERLDELAALAAPVSGDGGRAGPEVTRRVLAVAQWYLGRR